MLETPPRPAPLHDEWFGLAPLATPESLSEVSSISSRASSLIIHSDKPKRKKLETQHETVNETASSPRGLRRTLKISNGLAKAGEDAQSNARFRAIGKAHEPPDDHETSSFASAHSGDFYASAKSSSGESCAVTPRRCSEHPASAESEEWYASAKSSSGDSFRTTPKQFRQRVPGNEECYASAKSSSGESFTVTPKQHHQSSSRGSEEWFTSAKSSSGESCTFPRQSSGEVEHSATGSEERDFCDSVTVTPCFELDSGNFDRFRTEYGPLNYHKPTTVILPTDEKFPVRSSPSPLPYLETDFSLSDPALNQTDAKFPSSQLRPSHLQQGVSFDQDYEFDIETESCRLLDSQNQSENSLFATTTCKSLQTQDSCYRDDDSLDDGVKRKSDSLCRVHFCSRSAEALPLLQGLNPDVPEKKRKYSFSILAVGRGESSV